MHIDVYIHLDAQIFNPTHVYFSAVQFVCDFVLHIGADAGKGVALQIVMIHQFRPSSVENVTFTGNSYAILPSLIAETHASFSLRYEYVLAYTCKHTLRHVCNLHEVFAWAALRNMTFILQHKMQLWHFTREWGWLVLKLRAHPSTHSVLWHDVTFNIVIHVTFDILNHKICVFAIWIKDGYTTVT